MQVVCYDVIKISLIYITSYQYFFFLYGHINISNCIKLHTFSHLNMSSRFYIVLEKQNSLMYHILYVAYDIQQNYICKHLFKDFFKYWSND